MTDSERPQTRVDRLLSWVKNNKFLSVLIVVGICIVALASFLDALVKISARIREAYRKGQITASFDIQTREEVIKVAKLVDDYCLRAMDGDAKASASLLHEERRRIEVELHSLLLRNESRPLNPEGVAVAKNALEFWRRTIKESEEGKLDKVSWGARREMFNERFLVLLEFEEIRKQKSAATVQRN